MKKKRQRFYYRSISPEFDPVAYIEWAKMTRCSRFIEEFDRAVAERGPVDLDQYDKCLVLAIERSAPEAGFQHQTNT